MTPDSNTRTATLQPRHPARPQVRARSQYDASRSDDPDEVRHPAACSVDRAFATCSGPPQLTGQAIAQGLAQQDTLGAWVVNYTLTSTGSPQWDKVAKENFHQELAIELDGVIQSAPLIQPTQSHVHELRRTGSDLGLLHRGVARRTSRSPWSSVRCRFGSTRSPPRRSRRLSATAPSSPDSAPVSSASLLVLLYTILYYRALGLVIVLGLASPRALLWAIISALGHTAFAPSFDLAGVTGIIVSIGITVDSYIVYFERLKDEARAGRSVRTSVDRGFRSAWRTVLAADTVSLLAAVLLYIIAVGDVRGFAFFLGLSTLMDVFITWYFTRPLVVLLGRRGIREHVGALDGRRSDTRELSE